MTDTTSALARIRWRRALCQKAERSSPINFADRASPPRPCAYIEAAVSAAGGVGGALNADFEAAKQLAIRQLAAITDPGALKATAREIVDTFLARRPIDEGGPDTDVAAEAMQARPRYELRGPAGVFRTDRLDEVAPAPAPGAKIDDTKAGPMPKRRNEGRPIGDVTTMVEIVADAVVMNAELENSGALAIIERALRKWHQTGLADNLTEAARAAGTGVIEAENEGEEARAALRDYFADADTFNRGVQV